MCVCVCTRVWACVSFCEVGMWWGSIVIQKNMSPCISGLTLGFAYLAHPNKKSNTVHMLNRGGYPSQQPIPPSRNICAACYHVCVSTDPLWPVLSEGNKGGSERGVRSHTFKSTGWVLLFTRYPLGRSLTMSCLFAASILVRDKLKWPHCSLN